jgi:hypothetical protein
LEQETNAGKGSGGGKQACGERQQAQDNSGVADSGDLAAHLLTNENRCIIPDQQ